MTQSKPIQFEPQPNIDDWHRQQVMDFLSKQPKSLFDDFHPYGNVFFNNSILKKFTLMLFTSNDLQMFKRVNWYIKVKDKNQNQLWQKKFQYIEEAQIQRFQYQYCNPKIIQSIYHIDFYELKDLKLYNCGIESLEALQFLNCPNITKINLIYNNISNYKPLVKCHFPKLTNIQLYKKKKKSNSELYEYMRPSFGNGLKNVYRSNFRLCELRVEKHQDKDVVIIDDLSFLSKVKKHDDEILSLYFNVGKRIIQQKVWDKFIKQSRIKFYGYFGRQNFEEINETKFIPYLDIPYIGQDI